MAVDRGVKQVLGVRCCGEIHTLTWDGLLTLRLDNHDAEDIARWDAFQKLGGELPVCLRELMQFNNLACLKTGIARLCLTCWHSYIGDETKTVFGSVARAK